MTRKKLSTGKIILVLGAAALGSAVSGCAQGERESWLRVENPFETQAQSSRFQEREASSNSSANSDSSSGKESYGAASLGGLSFPECSVRLREELTQDDNTRTSLFKTTFGLADCVNGKAGAEYLRFYNYAGKQGDKSIDYSSAALELSGVPGAGDLLKIGSLTNTVNIFGSQGDSRGLGLQTTHSWRDLTLTLNAEESKVRGVNPRRLGVGADYGLGRFTLGGGVDNVSRASADTNQYLVHGIWDKDDKNQFGLGAALKEMGGKYDKSAAVFWTHMNDSWGTRTWVKGDLSQDNARRSITFDSITVQNPTFSRFSSPWIVGRARGDMYNQGVTENSLDPEGVALGDRSTRGIVTDLKGNYTDDNGVRSGFARTDLGYRFDLDKRLVPGLSLTPTVYGRYDFSDVAREKTTAGAGLLARWNRFTLETGVDQPVNRGGKPGAYVGLQFSCPIGAPSRR